MRVAIGLDASIWQQHASTHMTEDRTCKCKTDRTPGQQCRGAVADGTKVLALTHTPNM